MKRLVNFEQILLWRSDPVHTQMVSPSPLFWYLLDYTVQNLKLFSKMPPMTECTITYLPEFSSFISLQLWGRMLIVNTNTKDLCSSKISKSEINKTGVLYVRNATVHHLLTTNFKLHRLTSVPRTSYQFV